MQNAGYAALQIIPSFKGLDAKLKQGLGGSMKAAGEAGGREFGDAAATESGKTFSSKAGDLFKKGAQAAAVVGGAALGAGIVGALERGAQSDKMAAALGLAPAQQQRLGKLAGSLYADAYGESFSDVANAIGAVRSSLKDIDGSGELKARTKDALNFATAFEVDVARAVQVAGTVMNSGLAKDSKEAFDLITTASQRVPAQLREDVLDAAEEYGTFFKTLGYDGPEAFALLARGADQGIYGIDKAGDAIKEFTIRSTDMSTASKDAYKTIGLDAEEMADSILAGGDKAQEATGKIIDGLLGIRSPSRRANAAIALFGTPIEDLNVRKIPDFLRSLKGAGDEMDGFRGSAKRMGDTLNDNASARVTAFKRGLENDLIEFLDSKGIPFFENEVVPAFKGIGDALDSMPSWAIKGTVGGVLGLVAAGKLGSLVGDLKGLSFGGGKGLGGSVASKAAPVPVFVTNPGFDGPGGGSGGKKPGGFFGALGLGSLFTAGAGAASVGATAGIYSLSNKVAPDQTAKGNFGSPQGMGQGLANAEGDFLDMSRTAEDSSKRIQDAFGGISESARRELGETAAAFKAAKIPDELKTRIALNGVPESMAQARALVKQYNLTPREKRTLFEMAGLETARSRTKDIIKQYNLTPNQVRTLFGLDGVATTLSQINTIENRLNEAARDRRAQITLDYRGGGTRPGIQEANGGIVEAFANGGFTSKGQFVQRVPQLRQGGGSILWNEPETGWEAYISGKPSMRERNLAVLAEASKRLGAHRYADGGMAGRAPTNTTRIVERVPQGAISAYVEGLGPAVIRLVDSRVTAHRRHVERQDDRD